ncbi:uncharacterized protein Bfra_007520 [Botrytis fragariae]|uniref:Uncharacterized protein n=1 Tax=Botrytis fragariae TaxID=1964551 RepID=A0A8H6EDP4_9HELO|nr:uncharacterized protein Bfra_007520 [Botrytis fragariae]KAF5868323.1 hypothetical protein Bfra_007520 [Botrytis fragariae]
MAPKCIGFHHAYFQSEPTTLIGAKTKPFLCEESYAVLRMDDETMDCNEQAKACKVSERDNSGNVTSEMAFDLDSKIMGSFKEGIGGRPALFLSLIFNQGNNHPSECVAFDSSRNDREWSIGYAWAAYRPDCVIMHGREHGVLTDWDKNAAHRKDIIGFLRAHLIPRAQSKTVEILRRIVEQLVANYDGMEQLDICTRFQFRIPAIHGFFSGYEIEPYGPPQRFDIERPLSSARVALDIKLDHIELLQMDPAYAKRWLNLLGDGKVIRDPSFNFKKHHIQTGDLIRELMIMRNWRKLVSEIEKLRGVYYSTAIDDVTKALCDLEVSLYNCMEDSCAVTGHVLSQRPGFFKSSVKYFDEDPLHYCLSMVTGAPDEKYRLNRSLMFRYLNDYFQQATKEQRARVEEPLAMLYSDWATLHEIDTMISRHGRHEVQPQQYMEENGSEDAETDTEDWDSIEMKLHNTEALKEFSKLPLPSGKKDETWIACDINSRIALSKMWKGTRDFFRATLEHNGVKNKDIEEINAIFLDIDADHVANAKLKYDSIRARIESDLQTKNKKVNNVTAEVQTKTKIRTVAPRQTGDTVQAVSDVSAIEEVDATTTELQIKVDIKTLGIFTSMYSDPDGGQDTGTVS